MPPPTQYSGMPAPPQFGSPPHAGPPPPTAETRLPWPPPPGSEPPSSLPPSGQPPQGPQQPYGAPVPQDDQMSDTQRMLQPQGLFSSPRPFEPRPWPGDGGPASLFAPPLPDDAGGRNGGVSTTMPHGMRSVPPGAQQSPGSPYPPAPGGGYPTNGPYPPGPYGPGGPYPPGTPFAPGGAPPRTGGRRPWSRRPSGPLTPAIIAAVLVLVVAGVVIAAMHGNSNSGGTPTGSSTGTSPTATASANTQAERQAATQLATLLPQSGADRGKVIDAVVDVQNCGSNLSQDATTFSTAATNRQTLLTKLGSLTGKSALPPAMVSALTGAWQASAQADTDLAKWAQDELSHGCHKGKTGNDANLKASYGPDGQATTDKQSFTALWNPLARKYGLKTYQVGDL